MVDNINVNITDNQPINVTLTGASFSSTIRGDSGIPDNLLGINSDWYINTDNGYMYKKTSDVYVYQLTIKGEDGIIGEDGVSCYVYIAYASDDSGTNFTMIFNANLSHIAIKSTEVKIETPIASDFTGLWKNYKGPAGSDGQDSHGMTLASYTGLINGINKIYTLNDSYLDILVFLNGVMYDNSYYSYTSGILTFNDALLTDTKLIVYGITL